MPKPVIRKEPEPAEEEKSEPVEPYRVEEKDNVEPAGPQEPAMFKSPPKMRKAPETEEETGHGDEEEVEINVDENEKTLKSLNVRMGKLEKLLATLTSAVEKANYSSHPPSKDSDYPAPPEDGPRSDGMQAPKITQAKNPAEKPFGKDITKTALAGAGDGSREGPNMVGDEKRVALEQILKGQKKLSQIPRALRGV